MKAAGLAVYCADIGSVKNGNFGWAVVRGDRQRGGKSIGGLVEDVVASLAAGIKVALGFECPLWVPVPDDPAGLTAARVVDGNRSWSAFAGCVCTGDRVDGDRVDPARGPPGLGRPGRDAAAASLDWQDFAGSDTGLFLWEAFVTGAAKATDTDKDQHVRRCADRLQGVRVAPAGPGGRRFWRAAACGAFADWRGRCLVGLVGGPGPA